MTNEEIDALEGPELDVAFAGAFGLELHNDLELYISGLPEGLAQDWLMGTTDGEPEDRYWASFGELYGDATKDTRAVGPAPATAFCRAALKAKGVAACSPKPEAETEGCTCSLRRSWTIRGPHHSSNCAIYKLEPEADSEPEAKPEAPR